MFWPVSGPFGGEYVYTVFCMCSRAPRLPKQNNKIQRASLLQIKSPHIAVVFSILWNSQPIILAQKFQKAQSQSLKINYVMKNQLLRFFGYTFNPLNIFFSSHECHPLSLIPMKNTRKSAFQKESIRWSFLQLLDIYTKLYLLLKIGEEKQQSNQPIMKRNIKFCFVFLPLINL